jgi:predicted GIY-YIG superfamily endonuclease
MTDKKWYCYILTNDYPPHKNRTYNGSTNNPIRRLRQHNGEIVGGARYTKKYGNKSWRMYVLITGYPDHRNCLQSEWRIKKPNNRNRRGKYCTPKGRILGLCKVLKLNRWTGNSIYDNKDMKLTVWIEKQYSHLLKGIPDNIEVITVDRIDLHSILI